MMHDAETGKIRGTYIMGEDPLVLSTGRILYHWHGGTQSRRSRGLAEIRPDAEVEVNPVDAGKLDCSDGDLVELVSRRGKITAKVKVTEGSPEGVAFMTFHYKEAPANQLTVDALDPVAKIPEFKVCSIQINPTNGKERTGSAAIRQRDGR